MSLNAKCSPIKSAAHLLALINEALDFSRIGSERLELVLENVDLRTLFPDSLEEVFGSAPKGGIRLRLALGDFPPMVRMDKRKSKQGLCNLLSNE